MLVKFLAHGTGSAQAAADYLTRELDSQGEVREDVAVLRGDPDDVAAVADALEFDHKYTSGVIAWAPEDRPSDQDIDRVLDEFEQTAWAGLEPDRYAWAAVQHRAATGGVHVHVLAARCDLETGKSLNIAPPGWEQTYDPLVEACNLDKGWSRPDDPARAEYSSFRFQVVRRGFIAHWRRFLQHVTTFTCQPPGLCDWRFLVLLEEVVECFLQKLLNTLAVLIEHHLLELLRHVGVEVPDQRLLASAARRERCLPAAVPRRFRHGSRCSRSVVRLQGLRERWFVAHAVDLPFSDSMTA